MGLGGAGRAGQRGQQAVWHVCLCAAGALPACTLCQPAASLLRACCHCRCLPSPLFHARRHRHHDSCYSRCCCCCPCCRSSHVQACVAQFEQLEQECVASGYEDMASMAAGNVKYAVLHQKVVESWGRFPHRNAILGRQSTPEEEAGIAAGTIPKF